MARPVYQAVVFDAFGTLVQMGERRGPYRKLQAALVKHGRGIRQDDALHMLTRELDLVGIARHMGVELTAAELAPIEQLLYEELASIAAYPDAAPTVAALAQKRIKVAVCSNLAAPYGTPVRMLFPNLDLYAWSFRVGAVKPDHRMYDYVCKGLECDPGDILFVGDTEDADFIGPRSFGIDAVLLNREGPLARNTVQSLAEILPFLEG